MSRYIAEKGNRYLIRGPYTATELRKLYQSFLAKYPGTQTTFLEWLNRGKVYLRVTPKE